MRQLGRIVLALAVVALCAACDAGTTSQSVPDGDVSESDTEASEALDNDTQDADSADGDTLDAETEADLPADGDALDAETEAEPEAEPEAETEVEPEAEVESESETEEDYYDPSPIVRKVVTGGAHTCVLLDMSAVFCWGSNVYGQLGMPSNDNCLSHGVSSPCSKRPLLIPSLGGPNAILELALGDAHSCALYEGGKVRCWGRNNAGQLGDGTKTDRQNPAWVSGLPGACKAITARGNLTCALTESGAAYCWGDNRYGQLGETSADTCQGYGDSTYACSTTPVAVRDLSGGVLAISAGPNHVCAQAGDKTLRCWGYNGYGNLGDGTRVDSTTPVKVLDLPDTTDPVVAFSVAGDHGAAVTQSGNYYRWGILYPGLDCMGFGECCGIDECFTKATRRADLSLVQALALGNPHSCVIDAKGEVSCWGESLPDPYSAEVAQVKQNIGGALAIATGGAHSCAINKEHKVRCWGPNGYGQLGAELANCPDGMCLSETPIAVDWNL